ncbi:MAG: hypothetical protein JWN15_630 [Firmicutes bacterium]|nr:hypothetical protein [Bacillota bacterium]
MGIYGNMGEPRHRTCPPAGAPERTDSESAAALGQTGTRGPNNVVPGDAGQATRPGVHAQAKADNPAGQCDY